MSNYKTFKEAYGVYSSIAYFKVRKYGVNYLISIVNKITGTKHIWKGGFEELTVNYRDYQLIIKDFELIN